jgi:hypothetical protein
MLLPKLGLLLLNVLEVKIQLTPYQHKKLLKRFIISPSNWNFHVFSSLCEDIHDFAEHNIHIKNNKYVI